MPELLIELFSEEIPARMQARAAEDFARLLGDLLKSRALDFEVPPRIFSGPRRIGLTGSVPSQNAPKAGKPERGPPGSAPEQARFGFVKKFSAPGDEQRILAKLEDGAEVSAAANGVPMRFTVSEGRYWVIFESIVQSADNILSDVIPAALYLLPWPKSMRWGSSDFAWVRPLQRILCVFDGAPVHFPLGRNGDAAHGLIASNLTEGHRILAGTEPFAVRDFAGYAAGLRARFVIADAAERERLIETGIAALAAAEGLDVVPDRGLLAEVAGLVEWPVPLLGRIDAAFMDLPPEVMRTTMRVNQRYFTLRHPDGRPAPRFALVANIIPEDGGAAIIAGNERVLRARLADARFFRDQDRKQTLEAFLPKLESVVFHAKLGTQGERVRRLERLAALIAPQVGANIKLAARAALLAKADLASGMVGEFPEVQGIMGRYYALADGEDPRVAEAIGGHYRPMGPGDAVPAEPVAIAVALADKLDQLVGFFAAGEKPTGSGDPYALRRAALGIIRIIREGGLRLGLAGLIGEAFFGFSQATGATANPEFGMAVATETMNGGWQPSAGSEHPPMVAAFAAGVLDFLTDRLRVQLRAEGARHDLLTAVFGATPDDDLVRLLARAEALGTMLATPDGANLLAAYKRAANILRIETRRDGPHDGPVDPALLVLPAEQALAGAVADKAAAVAAALAAEQPLRAMESLAELRAPLDAFFESVVVNDPDPKLRLNRLRLLQRLCAAMDAVADFAKIEG